MNKYNQTSRILRKKKIFDCYISIHKSLGNVLITKTNKDKLNQKYEILNHKVRSQHQKNNLEDNNYQKRKRLNNDYNRNNLSISQQSGDINNLNISKIQKSKFAEKYQELYNMTINNNTQNKKRDNNSIHYFSNQLKIINFIHDSTEESKVDNLYDKNYRLKESYNNLKSGILTKSSNNRKYNNRNTSLQNLSNRINKKCYNNFIRQKIFKKIDDIKSALKSIDKMRPKEENKYNILINNSINNPKMIKNNKIICREHYNKNMNIYKSYKSKSSFPSQNNNRKYTNLLENKFNKKNKTLFGEEEKDKITDKINHFKVRLDLLSMK